MECPKCGAAVPANAAECPACGVMMAKASPRFALPSRTEVAAPPKAPAKSSALIKLIVAVLGVWFVWHLFNAKPLSADGWYEGASGYERALAEQKTNGKPVLVYFHTAWCGYCRRLDHDVLSTADFSQRYGSSMLKVSINPDKGRAEKSIARQYRIRGFPTIFVVASNRTSEPLEGYRDAETFYAGLAQAIGN